MLKDKVAIVAPSMSSKKDSVNSAIKTIRQMGLSPVVYKSCYMINDMEQVPAEKRAKDIMDAFQDDDIKAIIALRAGSGTLEVLDFLDFEIIRKNPKIFMGFSDITGMHLALNKYSDLISFYGPLATSKIRVKENNTTVIEPYTRTYLEKTLFSDIPIGEVINPTGETLEVLNNGKAKGELLGGNLTLLYQTLGTKYEIDTKGKIIFIEDFGESLSSIVKMIKAFGNAGKFDECAGIILGTWTKCLEEFPENERKEVLNKELSLILAPYGKPIISNIRSGHNIPMLTLPFGTMVEIDTEKTLISFCESATVSD